MTKPKRSRSSNKRIGTNREDLVIQRLLEKCGYLVALRAAASKPRLSKEFERTLRRHGFEYMPRPDISAYTAYDDQLLIAVTDVHCPARAKLKKYVNFMNLLLVPVYFQVWIAKRVKLTRKDGRPMPGCKYEFEIID